MICCFYKVKISEGVSSTLGNPPKYAPAMDKTMSNYTSGNFIHDLKLRDQDLISCQYLHTNAQLVTRQQILTNGMAGIFYCLPTRHLQ